VNSRILRNPLFFILLLALAGMALVFYSTTLGPGVGGDATIYLTSAKNLVAGHGLGWSEADGSFRLLPYTPPFYPLALSFVGLFGDMVGGARLLNILLAGGLAGLVGWAFWRFTGSGWMGVILSALVALSPVLLGVQVWAMSEPLFLFLGFSGLFALLVYLNSVRRRALVASALLCGMASLTRYMGLAFIATGGLALFLMGRGGERVVRPSLRRREISEAALFGFISLLPVLIWFIVDVTITGAIGSRSAQPASVLWQRFLEMGPALQKIYLFWFLPDSLADRLPAVVQSAAWMAPLAILAGISVLVAAHAHSSGEGFPVIEAPAVRMAVLFGLFIAVYLLVLAVAQVFTYPPITLASRMLSPVHLAALVFLPVLLLLAAQVLFPRSRLALAVISIALCVLAATYGLRSLMIARDYHQDGIGYNSLSWRSSSTIAELKKLPPDIPLISNESTAIMYLAGRPAYALQEIYQDQPLEPFTVYGSGDDEAQRVFREENGALVLFKANLREDFAMYGGRIDERLGKLISGLYLYYESEDGAIYFFRKPGFVQSAR